MAQAVICRSLPQRSGFNTRLVNLRFVADRVALAQVFFFASTYANFLLPESFHQCSILVVIYMLLLPEKQMGKAWGNPPKSRKNWALGIKVLSLFFCM